VQLLEGVVQHYDWGSPHAIPDLVGAPADGTPWAELWFGAHERGPARLGDGTQLRDRIDHDPVGQLGDREELPFLFKVLAADKPLSIQAHPDRAQAEQGFAREDERRIPVDAFERSFRDRNPKPELICALTPFEALCGFRSPGDSVRRVEAVNRVELDPVVELLRANAPESRRIGDCLRWFLDRSPAEAATLVDAAVAVPGNEVYAQLHRHHPGDVGVLVALLMHHVTLQPGEALFLGAGNLHAYVRGVGVELMANSDNVVRGGLTTKHIDRDTLLALIDCDSGRPRVQRPRGGVHTYEVPVADFSLTRVDRAKAVVELTGPAIALATDGEAQLANAAGGLVLARGQAAWIPACEERVEIDAGAAQLHLATTGTAAVR